jgi:acyl carrier protein
VLPGSVSDQEILDVIAEEFGVPAAELPPGLRLGIAPWTSLNHVALLTRLSELYGIEIDDVAVQRLTSARAIADNVRLRR